MNPPTPESFDEQLRRDAQARRATLDGQASLYPVGDYPARRIVDGVRVPAPGSGPSVLTQLAWLVGLGGATTAGLLLMLTLAVTWSNPAPAPPRQTLAITPATPGVIAASVRSLVTGLHLAEVDLGLRLTPTLAVATAWPMPMDQLQAAFIFAEKKVESPVNQEILNLQADLRTAAAYFRHQWASGATPGITPGSNPGVTPGSDPAANPAGGAGPASRGNAAAPLATG